MRHRERHVARLGLALGLAVVVGLVAWRGVDPVVAALAALGWGFVLLPPAYLPNLVLTSESWRLLFEPHRAPTFGSALAATWIGGAAGTLLPITGVGGEAVRARALVLAGVAGTDAGAAAVVAQTNQAISLGLWALVGVALLLRAGASDIVAAALVGIAVLSAGIAGFVLVQRAGLASKTARALTGKSEAAAERVDESIRAAYRRPGRLALAIALHLAARVALTAEVWLAALLIGSPVSVFDALLLKSLTGALRGAAFVVPAGLGVQEAGYVAVGAAVGLEPELMLAVSLASRGRELVVGVPALLLWQRIESRRRSTGPR